VRAFGRRFGYDREATMLDQKTIEAGAGIAGTMSDDVQIKSSAELDLRCNGPGFTGLEGGN
jgi:hypothetical protein